jgi:hypothetical protein
MSKNETVRQDDENLSIRLTEDEFLKMKLECYIESSTIYDEESTGDQRDYTSILNNLLKDYILRNFTLHEIYIIFIENQITWFLYEDDISINKKYAVECINWQSLPPEEKKRMKKKVWGMPKVLFGLVQELIWKSRLFWNEEKGIYEFPDLSRALVKYTIVTDE